MWSAIFKSSKTRYKKNVGLTTSAGRQMSLGETLTGVGGCAAMASGTVFQTGWERKEDIPLLVTHFLEKSVCIFLSLS